MQGSSLPVQAALDLYHILSKSGTDLRQPIGLKKQLLQEYSLDADVGQSMLQLLQVHPTHPSRMGSTAVAHFASFELAATDILQLEKAFWML